MVTCHVRLRRVHYFHCKAPGDEGRGSRYFEMRGGLNLSNFMIDLVTMTTCSPDLQTVSHQGPPHVQGRLPIQPYQMSSFIYDHSLIAVRPGLSDPGNWYPSFVNTVYV